MAETLVLWDIDGTLVDTAGHGRDAFFIAFERLFGRAPEADGLRMAGRTDHDIALELLERNGVEEGEPRLLALFDALHDALVDRAGLITRDGRALPGVREALTTLAARPGVIQGLLTGNIVANARVKLAAFELDDLIDFGIGGYGSDHRVRSELVAIARERARARHGVDVTADRTVLIGDTPRDVEAAHAVGARAVGVATGPFSVDELRDAGADAVLPDVGDTQALLAALR